MNGKFQELFSVETTRDGPDAVVVLRGEFDIAAEEQAENALARVLASPPAGLTIDLRELTFLDSTGLRVLLRLRQHCHECACGLSLIRGAPPVDRVFEISGVASHFTIADESDRQDTAAA
ncbi:MAG TPA: STAS domain-containing protein [Solirubrobacteraceae bacterium]|nr:STAS domain-containing protein [Solirubrobacteraceae bacterium]